MQLRSPSDRVVEETIARASRDEEQPRSTAARNHVGTISLVVAAGGLVVLETLRALDVASGWAIDVPLAGFAAGTAGAVADWFAVSALFRRVPIPFLGRHTNILVASRARFSAGLVEMVERRWLSPDAIEARLSRFSLTAVVTALADDPARKERFLRGARTLAARLADDLDSEDLARFVGRVLHDELAHVSTAPLLGRWIGSVVRRGEHEAALGVLVDRVEAALSGGGAVHAIARDAVERAVASYGKGGVLKQLGVSIARSTGALDADAAATSVVAELARSIAAAKERGHPLRDELDATLLRFARDLERGDERAVAALHALQARLAAEIASSDVVRDALRRLGVVLAEELARDGSDLAQAIERTASSWIESLRADRDAQERLDRWFRATAKELVERHHHLVGEMVMESLNRLSDRELVAQVRDNVWDDLQYIRLNGAIVGAAVGVVLALVELFLRR